MAFSEFDKHCMHLALQQADLAAAENEVPVGAVVALDGKVIAAAFNQPIQRVDASAHAEILALRKAGEAIGNYRLLDATLYVTLEPCVMCAGAIIHARVKRVVYGATDPKAGAVTSVFDILGTRKLNHFVDCSGGLLEEEGARVLRNFFKERRK